MRGFFILTATITIAAAVGAVTLRNLVHCALCLIAAFCGIGAAFVLLQAPFLAAIQLLVYVGAIAVLILFAIMLTRHVTGDETLRDLRVGWLLVLLLAAALFGLIVAGLAREPILRASPPAAPGGSPADLGQALMTSHVLPFELVSILLTAALIGAVVVAMEARRRGHDNGAQEAPGPGHSQRP